MCLLAVNPITDAYLTSDIFGKSIFWALFILSIITWVIFLQKWMQHQKAKKGAMDFLKTVQNKEDMLENFAYSKSAHPFSLIAHSLKEKVDSIPKRSFSDFDKEILEAFANTLVSQETKKLHHNLFILSTTVSLAPFLGLLGTVWGILLTFVELKKGVVATSSQVVLGGLAMALGTTVAGLVVAIPALIAYNYLKNKASVLTTEMEDCSQFLLANFFKKYTSE